MERSNVLYFELEGGRFIIRPSGTEPKLKSYLSASAAEKTEADSKLAQLKDCGVSADRSTYKIKEKEYGSCNQTYGSI